MIDMAILGKTVSYRMRHDAEGATLRSMLAHGADSVMHAEHLRSATDIPDTPFIAVRRSGFGSSDGLIDTGTFRLFCYDHPSRDYWYLNNIATELTRLFSLELTDPALALDWPHIASVGDETSDTDLGLLLIVCELAIAGV